MTPSPVAFAAAFLAGPAIVLLVIALGEVVAHHVEEWCQLRRWHRECRAVDAYVRRWDAFRAALGSLSEGRRP